MQTKNTIKQFLFLIFTLVVAEGVFGMSFFWPVMLVMKDKKWIYTVALVCGLFLSVVYSQAIGLMSMYLVLVLGLVNMFIGESRALGKLVGIISVLAAWLFDFAFGLGFGVWEVVGIILISLLVEQTLETLDTIRLNI